MLIPVKDENGEEAFLGTKEEFELANRTIKSVYVCIEHKNGEKVDQFLSSIEEAKEFLETYN